MSPSRQDQPNKPHPSASIITDVNYDNGPSVRRATGSINKAPSLFPHTPGNMHNTPHLASRNHLTGVKKRKVVQHGIIQDFRKIEIIIYAEVTPWWLLSIDASRVSKVCFPMFSCREALLSFIRNADIDSPIASLLNEMDNTVLVFALDDIQIESALLLVCGSVHFFLDIWNVTMNPKAWIFCTDRHQRMRTCPWGLSASERSPGILNWCKKVFGEELEILSPSDWFTRGHDHDGGFYDSRGMFRLNIKAGTYLWQPPPAAADAALEELRKARLKRRASTHIIIIPRLCTTLWLKQLYKAADIVLYLPCNNTHWPSSMFEPLVIAILFPYSRYFPWQFKGTPRLLSNRREMQSLLQKGELDPGDLLRKFFVDTRKISSLPEHLVRRLLHFSKRDDVPYSSSGGARNKRRRNN